jgi:NADPH-dependent curcumin reductase CurA
VQDLSGKTTFITGVRTSTSRRADHTPFGKLRAYLLHLYHRGRIKAPVHVIKGIENAPRALDLFWSGRNHGKLIIEV